MDEIEIERRITATEQRAKSNSHRIDKLEPIIEEIHTMSNTMVKLVQEIKHTNEAVTSLDEKVERMDSRVDDIERIPGENMKTYKRTAVTAVISTVAGALASGLLFLAVQYL